MAIKSQNKQGNPYHDESGKFTSGDKNAAMSKEDLERQEASRLYRMDLTKPKKETYGADERTVASSLNAGYKEPVYDMGSTISFSYESAEDGRTHEKEKGIDWALKVLGIDVNKLSDEDKRLMADNPGVIPARLVDFDFIHNEEDLYDFLKESLEDY